MGKLDIPEPTIWLRGDRPKEEPPTPHHPTIQSTFAKETLMRKFISRLFLLGILAMLWHFLTRDNLPIHPGHLEENGVDGQRAGLTMVWPGSDA